MICMICQLMAFVHDAFEDLGVIRGILTVDKECGFYATRGQLVKQISGIFARAVIVCDGQQLRAAIGGVCGCAQR